MGKPQHWPRQLEKKCTICIAQVATGFFWCWKKSSKWIRVYIGCYVAGVISSDLSNELFQHNGVYESRVCCSFLTCPLLYVFLLLRSERAAVFVTCVRCIPWRLRLPQMFCELSSCCESDVFLCLCQWLNSECRLHLATAFFVCAAVLRLLRVGFSLLLQVRSYLIVSVLSFAHFCHVCCMLLHPWRPGVATVVV